MATKDKSWTCSRCGAAMPLRDKLDHLQHCVVKPGENEKDGREAAVYLFKQGLGWQQRAEAAESERDALRLALQNLADAAETVMGEDESDPGWQLDLVRCDKAIDDARAVLVDTES